VRKQLYQDQPDPHSREEKNGQVHQVIAQREGRLLEAMATPQSLARLVARRLIYGKAKEPQLVYDLMEGQLVAKHLDRMLRQGLIAHTPAGFQRLP
jgi:hypothetical protein